jgi:MoxR-like ATPase
VLGVRDDVDNLKSETFNESRTSNLKPETFEKVCQAVLAGNSVIVLGEAGTGKSDFALALHREMVNDMTCARGSRPSVAIATYRTHLGSL